jgi:hypothetical protein
MWKRRFSSSTTEPGASLAQAASTAGPTQSSRKVTGFAQELLQLGRDRLQRELRDLLSIRAAEVAGEDDRGALRERVLIVGSAAAMRALLVMAPVALSCGTLKSTRMSTRFPERLRSRMDLNLAMGAEVAGSE